ncbi:hypothetical protein HK102_002378 [Quaeritorhiza haematococci]|nr:hypothetical protein HK102_002378 [Quaeritorhiza haematococci]
MQRDTHIIIVGAGVGGVATAARLAHAGFKVTVFEKNAFSGGRCSLIHKDGYRFDQGPSFYLMPKIFEETFADLGEDVRAHLDLIRSDPNYIVHFHDGDRMILSSDLAKLKSEVERLEPTGAGKPGGSDLGGFKGLLAFLEEGRSHYDLSIDMVLSQNFEYWYQFFKLSHIPKAFKLHIIDTLWARACRYFASEKVRRAFTFQSMYLGMSPFEASGTYNLLQYTEIAEGIWYPKGGFHKLVESLEKIAMKHGAHFVYEADVKRILIDPVTNRVLGIQLADEKIINADAVVCNADLCWAYNNLLPESSYAKRLSNLKQTSSSFNFYWGMKQKISQLAAHNIFLAEHYQNSFDQIFRDKDLPLDPSFYVNVPSRLDPAAAPEGKDAITILVPVGHILSDEDSSSTKVQDFKVLEERARKAVISTLEKRLGIPDFASLIEFEIVNTPHVWREKFNLFKGAVLGLSHNVMQVCYMRPSTRHATYQNLFFVGEF